MGGTGTFALLEVVEFVPFFMLLDGHALWHCGTALLSSLWFSFLKDEDLFIAANHAPLHREKHV